MTSDSEIRLRELERSGAVRTEQVIGLREDVREIRHEVAALRVLLVRTTLAVCASMLALAGSLYSTFGR